MIHRQTRLPLLRLNSVFRRSMHHGFDTYAFVEKLELSGTLDRKPAEAVMRALSDVVTESSAEFTTRAISREDFDKIVFSNAIDFNRLRGDLGLVEKNDFMLLKTEVMRLASDVERLQLRSAEEFRRIQTTNRLELSMEKSRIREEQNAQAIRMKEADAKIESELATIKTLLEGFNWDLFKTLFPLFSAAGALAFSYLRFVR
ncbi:mitochondrion protein [Obelidium mucronatum]|nr:mitochondrion protein [Obelidium mucronatum]